MIGSGEKFRFQDVHEHTQASECNCPLMFNGAAEAQTSLCVS